MIIQVHFGSLKAEKNEFIMVQMWPADSHLSGGHPDVLKSTYAAFGGLFQHQRCICSLLEVFRSLGMPFMMLPWCFSVLFSDGCVPETLLKPEVFLLCRSQNLSGFSCTEQKFEC